MKDLFGHDVGGNAASKSLDLQRSVARMAAYRQTPEYRQWLVESRDRRRQLKEKYRRQKGSKSLEQLAAEREQKRQQEEQAKIERQSAKLHAAHVGAWKRAMPAAWFRHEYRNNPEFNARQKLRARMRRLSEPDSDLARLLASYAKRDKWKRGWADILGYGLADLIEHLQRMVPKGYTWQDFLSGALHIDHIVPRVTFDLSEPEELRACWALSNLQLLPARVNAQKSSKVQVLL